MVNHNYNSGLAMKSQIDMLGSCPEYEIIRHTTPQLMHY